MKAFKVGQQVICNGFPGTVMKVCDGQLQGMLEVRVPGGLTCVGASEVKATWTTVKGVATFGCYEVRVTARTPTGRPRLWAVFKVCDGARIRLTPAGKDFRSLAAAKLMTERVATVVEAFDDIGEANVARLQS